jgi:hypothetical protein
MGTLYEGSFTGGWKQIAGEEIPGLLADKDVHLEIDAEAPQYKRGPLAARPTPASIRAEVENKVQRAESETTMFDAFRVAGESLGLSQEAIADLFAEIVRPIPEPALSLACREGRHWAPDRPSGSCHGQRLTDDYEWKPCECPVCHGQEVELP